MHVHIHLPRHPPLLNLTAASSPHRPRSFAVHAARRRLLRFLCPYVQPADDSATQVGNGQRVASAYPATGGRSELAGSLPLLSRSPSRPPVARRTAPRACPTDADRVQSEDRRGCSPGNRRIT